MRMTVVVSRTFVMAGILLASARTQAEDRQIRAFVGATFAGATTFVDPEDAAGGAHLAIGASAVFLGEIFGAEVEVTDAPGFFEGDRHLVVLSRVTTISGNVIVAAPHSRTEYSLRPYLVAGAGLMRVRTTTSLDVFDVASVIPAIDFGAGALGFFTNRVGVAWDLRRFQSVGSNVGNAGLSFGEEHLSFWRATMAVVIRY